MASYTDKDIIHLKGLQAVRKRPGVYVGDITSPSGVFQLIKEGVDNSIDEALAGYCKRIKVQLNLVSREVIISDDGRGIPQKSLPTVFGKLHSGSKFSDKVYSVSGGTHGVGVSSTNALSSVFECFSIREGKSIWVKYKKGELIKGPAKKKPCNTIRVNGKHGTTIRFIPDFSLVTYKKLPYKMVLRWLEAIPLLCPGLKIEVSLASKTKTVEKTFFSKAGLKGQKRGKDLYAKRDNLELCISFLSEETKVLGYINTIAVREGSHIKAFWQALKVSLNKYAKKKSPRQASLKEGVQGIFHVLAKDPLYVGQTKEILGDTRIEKWVYLELKKVFDEYFEKNTGIANTLIKRALAVEALDKEHRSKLKSLKGIDKDIRRGRLPAALAVSSTKNKEERELFICEGESAGGCYAAWTKVRLINGVDKTFRQLVKDYEKGITHYGYTHVNSSGLIKVVPLLHPRITEWTKEVVKVTLDTGDMLVCSLGQKWKLRDGTYKEARDLESNDSLMPHAEEVKEYHGGPRRFIKHPNKSILGNPTKKGRWQAVHRVVVDSILPLRKRKKCIQNSGFKVNIHHKDLDTLNDHPFNLIPLEEGFHRRVHATYGGDTTARRYPGKQNRHSVLMRENPEYRRLWSLKQRIASLKRWWTNDDADILREEASKRNMLVMQDPRLRKRISNSVKAYWTPEKREEQSIRAKKQMADKERIKKRTRDMRKKYKIRYLAMCITLPELTQEAFDSLASEVCNLTKRMRLPFEFSYWERLFSSFKEFKTCVLKAKNRYSNNHKVVKTKILSLNKAIPLYDLTEATQENYALSCGVYVHNSGKAARDRRYQEILPVKGKILNVARKLDKPDKVLKSEEIQNIIKSIGGIDPDKGRVGKIILLSDSDVDGFHITALSSTLFVLTLPKWIQEGRVYTVIGPLFHTIYKGKRYFGDTAKEVQNQIKGKANIMRVKGWGEMKPEDLRYVALDPDTRVIKRLQHSKRSSKKTMELMGSDTNMRKRLLGLD